MPDKFTHDVFLSHSAKDKAVVREPAERFRKDRLRVWFDEWEIKPGDNIPAKLEEGPFKFGIRNSEFGIARLCLSANAFGSDWAQFACPALASQQRGKARTCGRANLAFRGPLNQERCFIPLRLDDATIKGSVVQSHSPSLNLLT